MVTSKVKFRRLSPNAEIPVYQTAGAVGMDLCSCMELRIPPGCFRAIPTGLALELPPGLEAQVRPRSGLAAKYGITVLNAPGTIDSDYRGEIKAILINHGGESFIIKIGDRIAQLVFAPVTIATLEEADELDSTDRGAGGLGSTGV